MTDNWTRMLATVALLSGIFNAQSAITLAAQMDWGAVKGFYVALENPAGRPPVLAETKLVLGVADGANWRWVNVTPKWKWDTVYTIRMEIRPDEAELFLDGVSQGVAKGSFIPFDGDLVGAQGTGFTGGPGDYAATQTKLTFKDFRGTSQTADISAPNDSNVYRPQAPVAIKRKGAAPIIEIEAGVRFSKSPSLYEASPFVDRYGQYRHSDWPGKVKTEADIIAGGREEARVHATWPAPKGYDKYGGRTDTGWKEKGTGFFRVAQKNGYWFLITPEGNPCFYTGLCTVEPGVGERTPVNERLYLFDELPPRTGPSAGAWARNLWGDSSGIEYVSYYTWNVARKYGDSWPKKSVASVRERLSKWGFTGLAKWVNGVPNVPYLPYLAHWDVPNLADHPDVFDPAIRKQFANSLKQQMGDGIKDPWIVGWSVGNEYPQIIKTAEIRSILTMPGKVPAKRALIDHVVHTTYNGSTEDAGKAWGLGPTGEDALYEGHPDAPAADIEKMRRYYQENYYAFMRDTVQQNDPNHLYLGCWPVPGWWENDEDWRITAAYCDVMGFDRYAATFTEPYLDKLIKEGNKPILCGEFAFPPYYDGMRGFGRYSTIYSKDDADAARYYRTWMKDAAANPYCVGVCYFQYRDQAITGRGPGRGEVLVIDENFAFGLVDVADRPKWDLVTAVRESNLAARVDRFGHAGIELKSK